MIGFHMQMMRQSMDNGFHDSNVLRLKDKKEERHKDIKDKDKEKCFDNKTLHLNEYRRELFRHVIF